MSGLIHNLPRDWAIEWWIDRADPVVQTIESLTRTRTNFPSLPPFGTENPQQPATAAITIGLAEQLRNLRHHWLDNEIELCKGFQAAAFERLAKFIIMVDPEAQKCQLEIEAISFYRDQESIEPNQRIFSKSIDEIQRLEKRALSIKGERIVETFQPMFIDDSGDYRRIWSLWIFNYGRVRKA